ncbi:MAG: hypothetical protein ABSH01_15745, partial [Terriglobia bacterium]
MRRRPCASLTLHLHQVGWRTFTSELSNTLGTPGGADIAVYVGDLGGGRVGEVADNAPLPSSNRTCGFPASGSRRDLRREHAQVVPPS